MKNQLRIQIKLRLTKYIISNNTFIKEKNSRWGFTVIKQVGDLAWPQIHLHSLYSHELGYRALFQLTVCVNSVGVCVHQMNNYLPDAYILKHTKSTKRVYIYKNIRKKRQRKKNKREVIILHEIKRPNSLKIVPSGVANYCNLPFGGRETRGSRVRLPREENARSRHQRLFEENVGKTEKRRSLRTFK